jgi:hypothetical protein
MPAALRRDDLVGERPGGERMQVAAFAKAQDRGWRWRIVNYAGDVIEESSDKFSSIAAAVAEGSARLLSLNVVDRSEPARPWRRVSHAQRH